MTSSAHDKHAKRTTSAPASPRSDEPNVPSRETRWKGGNVPYIEPPTIPAGMTVETYRRVRRRRKAHRILRLASPTLWLG